MRLLLTRPMADALPLAEKLAAQGHDILISPVIHIEPTEAVLPPPQGIACLALTSANGVRALAARLQDKQLRAEWLAKPAFAVGPQTAAALQALGWPDIHIAGGDVEALATCIIAHNADNNAASNNKDSGTVLHIAGRHQAGYLQAALEKDGLAYEKAVLYQASPADGLSAAAEMALTEPDEPLDAVLVYSQRSAKLFAEFYAELANTHAKPLIFCLSEAVAEPLRARGFDCRIAATADEAGMLALTANNR